MPADLCFVARSVGRSIFGADASGYHTGRLDYPPEIFERIFTRRPDDGAAILEIGAGTGIATQGLLASNAERLVAVEPDPVLAAYLRGSIVDERLEIVEADFVAAPVEGPFDLVASASSYHWLDPDAGPARIRQLLRRGGTLAVWWNAYRQRNIGDAFADALIPLLEGVALPPSEAKGTHYSLDIEERYGDFRRAGFVDTEHFIVRRERTMTTEQVLALYKSYSFIRALDDATRDEVLGHVQRIADDQFGGVVPNVVFTALYLSSNPA